MHQMWVDGSEFRWTREETAGAMLGSANFALHAIDQHQKLGALQLLAILQDIDSRVVATARQCFWR